MNAKTAALFDALTPAQQSQIIDFLRSTLDGEESTIIDCMDKPTLEVLIAMCKAELDKRRINR